MIQGWKWARRWLLLLVAGAVLMQSGCLWLAVGAGTAAGCAAGFAYLKGEVPQTYVASFDDTWNAAQTSLTELGMPVVSAEKKSNKSGTIKSRLGNGDAVAVQIDEDASTFPADGPVSRVGVRVALMGDYPISDRILSQIGAHLVPPAAVTKAPGVVPIPGTKPATGSAVVPAGWTGVPSPTPPAPPATTAPAVNPAARIAPTPQPANAMPATTAPPPLATPEPEARQ